MKNGIVMKMDVKWATIFTSDFEFVRVIREPYMYIGKEISEIKENRFSGTPAAKRRLVLVTVLTVIIMAGSLVLAVDYFTDGNLFNHVFNVSENDSSLSYLSGMGMVVNDSQSVSGVMVNLTAIVGDENMIYVLFDVNAPKGTDLTDGCRFGDQSISPTSISTGGASFGLTQRPENNIAQFSFRFSTIHEMTGQYITIMLTDFYNGDKKLASGTWKYDVKLDYPVVSRSFKTPDSEKSSFDVGTLQTLTLSPIKLEIQFDPYAYSEDKLPDAAMKKVSVQLRMDDGSTIYLNCSETRVSSDENTSKATLIYDFPRPININEVVLFQADGRDFLLDEMVEK